MANTVAPVAPREIQLRQTFPHGDTLRNHAYRDGLAEPGKDRIHILEQLRIVGRSVDRCHLVRQRRAMILRTGTCVALEIGCIPPEGDEKQQNQQHQHKRTLIRRKERLRDRDDRNADRQHYRHLHQNHQRTPRRIRRDRPSLLRVRERPPRETISECPGAGDQAVDRGTATSRLTSTTTNRTRSAAMPVMSPRISTQPVDLHSDANHHSGDQRRVEQNYPDIAIGSRSLGRNARCAADALYPRVRRARRRFESAPAASDRSMPRP